MTLCEADITSGIDAKVKRYMANFRLVREKMADLEERDRIRNFQPPVTGEIIMQTYCLPPCRAVGEIKERIKNAILDGEIRNDYDEAYALMERLAAEQGADEGAGRIDCPSGHRQAPSVLRSLRAGRRAAFRRVGDFGLIIARSTGDGEIAR